MTRTSAGARPDSSLGPSCSCIAVENDESVDSVGRGGTPDASGHITLDGSIMLSPSRSGAVAALTHCANPVSVARKVMELTPHKLLVGDGAKVAGDARLRVGGSLKPLQLRVPSVAARAPEQHRLREERFAPQGDEAGGVEVAGMDGPETHDPV